jgi:hypothetical protein
MNSFLFILVLVGLSSYVREKNGVDDFSIYNCSPLNTISIATGIASFIILIISNIHLLFV